MRARKLLRISVVVGVIAVVMPASGLGISPAHAAIGTTVLQGFDVVSNSWTNGNVAGYAETDVIPYREIITGGNSASTINSFQTIFDHSKSGVPGIEDLQDFAICTGALTAGPPGATGCTPTPVVAPTGTPPGSGPYVQGPFFQTGSGGVEEGFYVWHNVAVPAATQIVLLWGAKLALGAHDYPGSSLSVKEGAAVVDGSSTSFGGKNVPIPVTQIIATETDKKINGSDTPSAVNVGDTVAVTISVQTFGPRRGTQDVVIEDELPPCLSYVSGSGSPTPVVTNNPDGSTTLSWTFNNVANGTTLSVSFSATAASPASPCTNVAITTSDKAGPTQDEVPITIIGQPDLALTKSCPPTASPNGTVTHTLQYSNGGTSSAAGVTITDVLSGGQTYVAGSAQLNGSPITPTVQNNTPGPGQQTLTFTIGTVAAGGSGTVTYDVHIPSTGSGSQSFDDSATINTTSNESNTANNTAGPCTTGVLFQPDLTLNKTCPTTGQLGSSIQHQLLYANAGSGTATGVSITDVLPTGLSYLSGSATNNGSPITPTVQANTPGPGQTTLTFNLGTLAPGASGTVQYSVTVTTTGSQTNAASISANETDSAPSNNNATCITSGTAPDLTLTKSCPTTSSPSGTVTHSLSFSNNGSASAAGVTITDVLSGGQTYVAGSAQLNGSPITPTVQNNTPGPGQQTLTFTIGTVAAGGSGTITYDVQIPATGTGTQTFSDTATISTTSNESSTSNNTGGPCTTSVTFRPDLTLNKTCPPSPELNDTVQHQLLYANSGTAPATGVTITDVLPAGLTYVSGSATNNGSPITPTVQANTPGPGQTTLIFSLGTLAPGASGTIAYSVTVTQTGSLTDSATIAGNETDGAPSNNSDSCTSGSIASDVFITKGCPDPAQPGEQVTHTLSFGNTGNAAANSVTITDVLGAGETYVSGSAKLNGNPITPTVQTNTPGAGQTTLTFTLGTLAAESSGTITYDVTMQASTSGAGTQTFSDTATISTTSSQTSTTNDSSTCTTRVTFRPDLGLTKTCPSAGELGNTVTHQLAYANTGTASATGVAITDVLPAGLAYVSGSATNNGSPITPTVQANTPGPGQTTLTFTLGTLAAGASGTIQYSVTVTGTGSQTDSASIAGNETDPTPSNNNGDCTSVFTAADVFLTKACPTTAQPGEQVTHTLNFGNTGNAPAGSVTITDVLGIGETYVTGSAKLNGNPVTPTVQANTPGPGQTTLVFNLGTLAAESSGTITYDVTMQASSSSAGAQSFSDTATIRTTSSQTSTTNDSSTCTTSVTFAPLLSISKVACPGAAVPGGFLDYTITFSNTGTAPAANTVVVDEVSGAEIASAPGADVSDDQTMATWDVGLLGIDQTQTLTLTVLVTGASGSLVENTASITADDAEPASVTITTPVSAEGSSANGLAYGLDVRAAGLVLVGRLGAVDSSATAANPGPQAQGESVVPLGVPGIATAQVVRTSSQSAVNDLGASSTNTATILNVNLLAGAIRAQAVHGVSQSAAGPFSASYNSNVSTFTALRINGKTYANVRPNTAVTVKNPLVPAQTLARAVLYEEDGTSSINGNLFHAEHVVNMIHVTLLKPFGTLPAGAEITVSHAESFATYRSGLACGVDPGTVSGLASAAFAEGRIGNPPKVVATGHLGAAELPPTGGSDSDSLASIGVPGVITTLSARQSTLGSLGPTPNATARSIVEKVDLLGGLIRADVLDVRATASATGTTASMAYSANFLNLAVGSTNFGTTPGTNTTIAIPQPDGSLVMVILNEHITNTDGTHNAAGVINALHVFVLKDGGIQLEIMVAHAHADAHQP